MKTKLFCLVLTAPFFVGCSGSDPATAAKAEKLPESIKKMDMPDSAKVGLAAELEKRGINPDKK